MDSFILEPLDQVMMTLLAASRALAAQDEYRMDYFLGSGPENKGLRNKYADNF